MYTKWILLRTDNNFASLNESEERYLIHSYSANKFSTLNLNLFNEKLFKNNCLFFA